MQIPVTAHRHYAEQGSLHHRHLIRQLQHHSVGTRGGRFRKVGERELVRRVCLWWICKSGHGYVSVVGRCAW